MAEFHFEKGLQRVARDVWAYLQPDGSWGLSNAGLIAGEGESMLVDTLFDLDLTREMLAAMDPVTRERPLTACFNTHANGDHCYGNQLLPEGARIYAATSAAHEMAELPAAKFAAMLKMDFGPVLTPYLAHTFGRFHFDGIEGRMPTDLFDDRRRVEVGGRAVELIGFAPAHTHGDAIAFVPDAGVVFAGDLLFIGGTPVVWGGPFENWIRACDTMAALDADIYVPGHGPITDKEGVAAVRRYLAYVRDEGRRRFERGMSARDAAFDIALGEFAAWIDSERLVVNVDTLYRELDPGYPGADIVKLFSGMAEYRRASLRAT